MFDENIFFNLNNVETKVIIEKSDCIDDWDSWGVRDVAPLSYGNGSWIYNDESITLYYTGSSNESKGQEQSEGVSIFDCKFGIAKKYENNPVIKKSSDSKGKSINSSAWVISETKGNFKMVYRAAEYTYEKESIGFVEGNNKFEFEEIKAKKVLYTKDFNALFDGYEMMAVFNICKLKDSGYLISFEGHETGYENEGQIFAAITYDWESFTPYNDGLPIFTSRDVSSWPVKSVCNPRIIQLKKGWYMLTFNGSFEGEHTLGFAYTNDFKKWIEHPQNPILVPRGWPSTDPFSGRLEGGCLDREAILNKERFIKMFFMAIPVSAQNHKNAVNALVSLETTKEVQSKSEFVSFPSNQNSVTYKKGRIILNSFNENSEYIQTHKILEKPIKAVSFSLNIHKKHERSSSYVIISNTFTSLPRGIGLIFKINQKGIFLYSGNDFCTFKNNLIFKLKNLPERIKNKILRTFNLSIKGSLAHSPERNWKTLKKFNSEQLSLDLKIIYTPNEKKIFISEEEHDLSNFVNYKNSKIITFAAFKSNIKIDKITFNKVN